MDEIYLAGLNLTFDFVKHITTLDTGLIVILATLLEKVFKENLVRKQLVVWCIASLGVSIIGSLIFLGFFSTWILYRENSAWPEFAITIGFWLSILGFFLALLFFVYFVFTNFQKRYRD